MKKLKKSAVVIPALARIAVTAAASVSGTVAWFTATREATVTGGTFLAGTNEGDLVITATDGKGVETPTSADSNTQTITVLEDVKLLDASYSGTALTEATPFWTNVEEGEPGYGTNDYKAVPQQFDATSKFYYGVSWKLTFNIDVTNSTSNYDIFFNANGSSATETTSGATKTAFRVFRQSVTSTSTNTSIVWAPFASTAEVNGTEGHKLGYVSSVNDTTLYSIAGAKTHGLISNNNDSLDTLALDNVADNNQRGDWLAKCDRDEKNHKATATVQVVVWFEGLDANMISNNLNNISSISTTMKFYARESASN